MSERKDTIYTVSIAVYAHIAVEADSPEEAFKIAERYKNDIPDGKFTDNLDCREVSLCDEYPHEAEGSDEIIYTTSGPVPVKQYVTEVMMQQEGTEEEEPE